MQDTKRALEKEEIVKTLRISAWMLLTVAVLVPTSARAAVAFITGGTSIWKWDTPTNTVSLVVNTGLALDSLIFNTSNNIISSRISVNPLGIFNGSVDTTLASTGLG